MSTLYEISLKKEIMREAYAGLMADFLAYFRKNNIDARKDVSHPLVLLFRKGQESYLRIMGVDTMSEMEEIEGQFKLLSSFMKDLEAA